MRAELIKDSGRISFIKIDDECPESVNKEELKDYELLNIIGIGDEENDLYLTKKIISKKSQKIYVEKDIKIENENYKENINNIFEILKKNECQNIVKHYKCSINNNLFNIINEYINNGDLLNYMKAYKSLGQKIEVKTLWYIFLQCAASLKYIHSKNIIHRNIKLDNIYITNDKIVKLGNFSKAILLKNSSENNEERLNEKIGSFIYRSPEMEGKEENEKENFKGYGKKTDIYSLGVVFYKLCFYEFPKDKDKKNNEEIQKREIPKEMDDIIKKMLSKEKERPNSNHLYDLILNEYVKQTQKNTSIEAVFQCLNSYDKFNKVMIYNKNFFEKEAPFCFTCLKCLEDINDNKLNKDTKKIHINNIRNLINNINRQMNNNEEIEPKIILDYLLEYMNKEMNKKLNKIKNNIPENFNVYYFKIQPLDFVDDEEKAKSEFNEKSLNYFNSIIKDNFCVNLEIVRFCMGCKKESYCFNLFPYLELNLDRCIVKKENSEDKYEYDLNIFEWFKIQQNNNDFLSEEYNIYCQYCKKINSQKESKKIKHFSNNLIFVINRGERNENKAKIKCDINAVMDGCEFNLVGIIKRIEKGKDNYYISIVPDGDGWVKSDKNSVKKIKDPLEDSEGDVIMLFYSCVQLEKKS